MNPERLNPNIAEVIVERTKRKAGPILRAFNEIATKEHGRGQHQHQQGENERRHSHGRSHAISGGRRCVGNERQDGNAAHQRQGDEWNGDPIGRQATTPQINPKRTNVPNAAIKM